MDIIKINDKSDKLYYVGGIVRDELLNIDSLDVDLVYDGDAIEFAKTNNLEILQINEPFGTVRVRINDKEIDIASTRTENYPKEGHLPVVEKIGCSLKEDVLRRDFTVNSLYKSVETGEIVDFTGGLEDLKNKKLKVLHEKSFVEDPTRIIRALKFRMRFGFELDENTKRLQDEYLNNVNYDMCYKRIKKELVDTFNYKGETALSLEETFKIFVQEGIFKLLEGAEVLDYLPLEEIPQNLTNQWMIFAGRLTNIEKLPLTREEQKILDDVEMLRNSDLKDDFEIVKAFEKCSIEAILLYSSLGGKEVVSHYLNDLKDIKIEITGKDLINLGLKPSEKFQEIFDYVLKEKLKNPKITKEDEVDFVINIYVLPLREDRNL